MAVQIYIAIRNAQGFLFLPLSQHLIISCLFDNSRSDRCEITSHCGFDVRFSISGIEHLFRSFLGIPICSLEKCLFRSSAHFLNQMFAIKYMSSSYILNITFCHICDLQIFSPIQ